MIKKHSHLPVIVDPSHGIGIGENVPAMALAAIACGADGLIVEVHTHPDQALSDGYQTINPERMSGLLEQIKQMAPIVHRTLS